MPRISPAVLRHAWRVDKLLPLLLPVCRDLASAKNELRWLREHARRNDGEVRFIEHLIHRRGSGEPLQYILGTEYFGDLEIICRPGVLIPRQETAQAIIHLVDRLRKQDGALPDALRVLDLCTGTGCIPLLFQHEFHKRWPATFLDLVGVDISPHALALANDNLLHQQQDGNDPKIRKAQVQFLEADVLGETVVDDRPLPLINALRHCSHFDDPPKVDILISNPPYISPRAFMRTTSRSVRLFEPRLALVPPRARDLEGSLGDEGDTFYPRLLEISNRLKSKVILFEVADMSQAQRVASMVARTGNWETTEIWRDHPASIPTETQPDGDLVIDPKIVVRGSGNGRAVFAYRGDASAWLKK